MIFEPGMVVNFNWTRGIFMKVETIYNYIYYKQSTATHSGIISRIEGNKVYIFEAIKEFKEYEYDVSWLENKELEGIVTIRKPNYRVSNVYKTCKKYEGLPYDWTSILLMPFQLGRNTPNRLFCSEGVIRVLYDISNRRIDLSAELGKSYERITPMDLQLSKQLTAI